MNIKTIKLWNKNSGAWLKTVLIDEKSIITTVSIVDGYIACAANKTITVLKYDQTEIGLSVKKVQKYKEHFKRF